MTMGSVITFDTTYVRGSKKFMTNSISYDSCLETSFYICKDPCKLPDGKSMYLSVEEQRLLMRWLNRSEFLKFRPVDDEYENLYYEGSFYNIEKIEFSDNVIGLQLHLITNSPFAFHTEEILRFDITSAGDYYTVSDISDDIGYVYADMEITCKQSGDLKITNNIDNRVTEIKNCTADEKITMKDMIIESSLVSHQPTLMNDFNFNFVRISNCFDQRANKLTFSLPCSVVLKYTPTMKVGI